MNHPQIAEQYYDRVLLWNTTCTEYRSVRFLDVERLLRREGGYRERQPLKRVYMDENERNIAWCVGMQGQIIAGVAWDERGMFIAN